MLPQVAILTRSSCRRNDSCVRAYVRQSIAPTPRPFDQIAARGASRRLLQREQLALNERPNSALNRAFGKAAKLRQIVVADERGLHAAAFGELPEQEVDEKGAWLPVMRHKIAHQGINDIGVN